MTGRKAPGVVGADEEPLGDALDGGDRVGDFRFSEWLDDPLDEFPLLDRSPALGELLMALALLLLFSRAETGYCRVLVSSSCSWPRC